jgi:acyl-CoA synthetase (AMP-forming)/AMP-acid ligase II
MNVFELITKNAKKTPDKPTLIFQDEPVTFGQLRETVFKLANGLDK